MDRTSFYLKTLYFCPFFDLTVKVSLSLSHLRANMMKSREMRTEEMDCLTYNDTKCVTLNMNVKCSNSKTYFLLKRHKTAYLFLLANLATCQCIQTVPSLQNIPVHHSRQHSSLVVYVDALLIELSSLSLNLAQLELFLSLPQIHF